MAELVLPLARFLPQLRAEDEVYAKALAAQHGNEKHTPSEWLRLVERMRTQPVSFDRLRKRA